MPPTSAPVAARRPVDRPPLVSRLFAALLGLGAALGAAALLLSDRAPGAVRSVFGERARRLWERIDASERVDLPPGSELPPADFLVHIGIWAVVATLVGLAVWSWRGLLVAGVLLVASSAALELAQGRYAETRSVEARDAMANAIGIGVGLVVAAGCYVTWSAMAALARRLRRS